MSSSDDALPPTRPLSCLALTEASDGDRPAIPPEATSDLSVLNPLPAPKASAHRALGEAFVGATASRREPWIDASRAFAVFLVVLLHATIGGYYLMPWASQPTVAFWDRANALLGLLRLPLLFLISGLLAQGAVARGWGAGKSAERAAVNYYLYLAWLAAFGGFLLLLPAGYPKPHGVTSWEAWAIQAVAPNTYLWYLFALAVYLPFFTLLRRLPPSLFLLGTLGLHLWATVEWPANAPLWTRVLIYAFFFHLGLHLRGFLRSLVRYALLALPLSLLAAWVLLQEVGLARLLSLEALTLPQAGAMVLLYLTMGAVAVSLVGLLTRSSVLARGLGFLGHHTLAIYTLHIPLITLANLLLLSPSLAAGLSRMLPAPEVAAGLPGAAGGAPEVLALLQASLTPAALPQLLFPLGLTVLVILGSVALEALLLKTPARWLFQGPAWVRRGARRATTGRVAVE